MNQEKEVTITDIKAKFTKDFDNSGNMTCFLEFAAGKCIEKTEVSQAQGKQPVWKNSVVLTFFDETHVVIRSYEGGETEKEYMGSGKLQIKSFRFPGGAFDLNLTTDSGQVLGSVSAQYTIKNLPAVPLLLARNLRLQLQKENKQIVKTRPYIKLTSDDCNSLTDPKQEVSGTVLSWSDNLRLRVKQNSKITITMLDKDQCNSPIFTHECNAKQFRCQNGSKKINIFDSSFNILGQFSMDYETVNIVTKQESVKNSDKEKKSENELTILYLDGMTCQMDKVQGEHYFKFIVGNNCFESEVVKGEQAGEMPIKATLFADSKENKMIVTVWQKTIVKDQLLASGCVFLDGISNGASSIDLCSEDGGKKGSVSINITCKQSACSSLVLSNISISIAEEDNIGNSEPFVCAMVGSCSGRTETASQLRATFKKGIELKFCNEEEVVFQIWDEDVAANSLLYSQSCALTNLKQKGEQTINVSREEESKPTKTGKIVFKYQYKNNETQKKSSVKEHKKETIEHINNESQGEVDNERNKKNSQASHDDLDNLANNRSKDTINLPSIVVGNMNQAYGDSTYQNYAGIFDRQSAATLQKSILAYSMPKANRFYNETKYSGEPSYCLDSCFRKNATKGAGFGFGRKKQFPDWMEKNMKENPAPGSYFDADHDFRNRGPTFGISHKAYEKVLIPKQKKQSQIPTTRKLSPIRDASHK